jgi:hypothetical protein
MNLVPPLSGKGGNGGKPAGFHLFVTFRSRVRIGVALNFVKR